MNFNDNLLKNDKKGNNQKDYDNLQLIIIGAIIILALIALILGFFIGRIYFNSQNNNKAFELNSEINSDFINNKNEENEYKKGNFSINI